MYEELAREMEQAIESVADRQAKRFFKAHPRYKKGGVISISEKRHTDIVIAVDMEADAVIREIMDKHKTQLWDIHICKIVINAAVQAQKRFLQRTRIEVYHPWWQWLDLFRSTPTSLSLSEA